MGLTVTLGLPHATLALLGNTEYQEVQGANVVEWGSSTRIQGLRTSRHVCCAQLGGTLL